MLTRPGLLPRARWQALLAAAVWMAAWLALPLLDGQVVTHRQLLADVWGAEYTAHTHYLRLYMGQLRTKLEADPAAPQLPLTEPGVGYRLQEPGA